MKKLLSGGILIACMFLFMSHAHSFPPALSGVMAVTGTVLVAQAQGNTPSPDAPSWMHRLGELKNPYYAIESVELDWLQRVPELKAPYQSGSKAVVSNGTNRDKRDYLP